MLQGSDELQAFMSPKHYLEEQGTRQLSNPSPNAPTRSSPQFDPLLYGKNSCEEPAFRTCVLRSLCRKHPHQNSPMRAVYAGTAVVPTAVKAVTEEVLHSEILTTGPKHAEQKWAAARRLGTSSTISLISGILL